MWQLAADLVGVLARLLWACTLIAFVMVMYYQLRLQIQYYSEGTERVGWRRRLLLPSIFFVLQPLFARHLSEGCRAGRRRAVQAWIAFVILWAATAIALVTMEKLGV
jgi:hypothetical protein